MQVCDLTKLDLSHNELRVLPPQLTNLGALATLLAA
jgi:Leucine-rich repeat (LRR) protein